MPRSPQGRPVIFQAGDSDEGREFAAAAADAIFTRHGTLEAGPGVLRRRQGPARQVRPQPRRAADPAGRDLRARRHRRRGRTRRPTDRAPPAGQRRRPRSSSLEQLWNRDLSDYDPDGPLPDDRPGRRREHHRQGPGQRADVPRPARHRRRVARAAPRRRTCRIRELIIEVTGRQTFIGTPATVAADHRRVRPGRRQRRLHPRPAHHPGRPRRLRRQGRAAAAGAGRLPHRVRGHDPARPPRPAAPARVAPVSGATRRNQGVGLLRAPGPPIILRSTTSAAPHRAASSRGTSPRADP